MRSGAKKTACVHNGHALTMACGPWHSRIKADASETKSLCPMYALLSNTSLLILRINNSLETCEYAAGNTASTRTLRVSTVVLMLRVALLILRSAKAGCDTLCMNPGSCSTIISIKTALTEGNWSRGVIGWCSAGAVRTPSRETIKQASPCRRCCGPRALGRTYSKGWLIKAMAFTSETVAGFSPSSGCHHKSNCLLTESTPW